MRRAGSDGSIVSLPGSVSGCRGTIGVRIAGRSVVHTPARGETGRLRAAQFAARAVYIPGGGPGEAEWDARTVVTADLLSLVRAGMARPSGR